MTIKLNVYLLIDLNESDALHHGIGFPRRINSPDFSLVVTTTTWETTMKVNFPNLLAQAV